MVNSFTKGLIAIMMAATGAACLAATQVVSTPEKFMGRWDRNAGIIGLYVREVDGIKQARMLVADEYIENAKSKLSIMMTPSDLDDFEDLLESAWSDLDDAEKLPVPPISTQESAKETGDKIGQLNYPGATIKLTLVIPPGTQPYVSMVVTSRVAKAFYVFWMEKEDIFSLKKLLDRGLREMDTQ
jgi:hypothetical protein